MKLGTYMKSEPTNELIDYYESYEWEFKPKMKEQDTGLSESVDKASYTCKDMLRQRVTKIWT